MYDHLKTPQNLSLNEWATRRIYTAIQSRGSAIPCSIVTPMGSVAEVNFDVVGAPYVLPNVVVSVAGWQWARAPIQVGDMGEVFPSGVPNGAVTGLGAGTPSILTQGGNLSSLVFIPTGNANWSASENPNAWVIYGPDGVILRDSTTASNFTLTPTEISMSAGGHSIVISSAGVVIDGKNFLEHMHGLVQTGSDDSGGVV